MYKQAFCNASVVRVSKCSIMTADRNEKVIWVGSTAIALEKPRGSKMELLIPVTWMKRLKGHSSVLRLDIAEWCSAKDTYVSEVIGTESSLENGAFPLMQSVKRLLLLKFW